MPLILILDDSTTLVMSLSRILKSAGYTVEACADGSEGIKKIVAGLTPSVILTDLHMPTMDGLEFIKQVRLNAATRFTPIIMLTVETDAAKLEECRAAGASEWLSKPTEPADLLAVLARVLASRPDAPGEPHQVRNDKPPVRGRCDLTRVSGSNGPFNRLMPSPTPL